MLVTLGEHPNLQAYHLRITIYRRPEHRLVFIIIGNNVMPGKTEGARETSRRLLTLNPRKEERWRSREGRRAISRLERFSGRDLEGSTLAIVYPR